VRPVRVAEHALDGRSGGQMGEPHQAQQVVLADALVVCGLGEGQRQEPLLLEVGLVDAGEAPGDDSRAVEQAR
jgi:hypothetical protein